MNIERGSILKALNTLKETTNKRKFTQAIDLIVNLKDIDLKRPENRINEIVELPHPTKSTVKIVVFANGDLALRAKKAGAYMILGKKDIERFINDKKSAKKIVKNTDFFIAETTLMPTIGKILGPILGPRGKMPTPTLPTAPIDAIIDKHMRSVLIRLRTQLNAQFRVGTEETSNEILADNIQAIFSLFERRLDKGLNNIRSSYVKSSMGSPIRIDF